MLLHGYNPKNGSFTGTAVFSNPVMEKAQKGDSIIVDEFDFIEDIALYKSDGVTFTLVTGWKTIKATRVKEQAAVDLGDAKANKVAKIDKQTSLDIVSIAGDAAKQRNYLASYLKTLSGGGDVTPYLDLWKRIEDLIALGNSREAQCLEANDMAALEAV